MFISKISNVKLLISIISFLSLYIFFLFFCLALKIKNTKYETENKQRKLYISTITITISLVLCEIFLIIMFFLDNKQFYSSINPLVIYLLSVICLLSMGIRSVFFLDTETKKQISCIQKRYRIWGAIAIVFASSLIILLFI